MPKTLVWCQKCGSDCKFQNSGTFQCECVKPEIYAWTANSESIIDQLQSFNMMVVTDTGTIQFSMGKTISYEFDDDNVDVTL